MNICCIKGCDRHVAGHFFCRTHYERWRRNGHPLFARPTARSMIGVSATKEYRAWQGARARCTKPHHRQWKDYGGRGITMCDRWRDSFEAFLSDMGPSPRGLSLERKNVNGPYDRNNCIWATMSVQNRNTRSVRLTADIVADAKGRLARGAKIGPMARALGVPYITLYQAMVGTSWKDVHANDPGT